ncbi:forkhead box protein N2-like [Harmonia axyridis]|uniref:forkhead box protein N2-like n=1 Tax=Harmonia axyridis TaxID=115357 RepID=UPI001E276AFC|nr:forkhead box protein N2-like [Harmonia axyridis]XP_045479054.1 forkhead box protein N2-like [Harmonia axyridis]
MSPERIGSQDDQAATPKMSVPASPVAGTPACEAQNPISLLLAVAQAQSNTRSPDDDLTSLSWLHEKDLLKGMNINPSPSNSTNSTPKQQYFALTQMLPDQSPTSDYIEDSSISPGDSSNSSLNSSFPACQNYQNSQQKNKHPHNVPYDPMVHVNNKPPYSFSCLIFMAIEESPQKALPVKEIYSWILSHFPYFQNAPTGWKNSVRHNLSLNKCFQKVEKAPNLGKGSLWTVDPQYKPNLIQALTRSPFHPCSNLDTSSYLNNLKTKVEKVEKKSPQSISRLPDPQLFPYLSKTLASVEMGTPVKTEFSEDSLDAVDAATVMLSLKNGPTMRQKKKSVCQVVTTLPSQDHTYSAANSSMSVEKEEPFDCDNSRPKKSSSCRKIDFKDDEEEKKIKGAEILLHFAGVSRTRPTYEPSRKKMRALTFDSEENDEKQVPFKPRLLRTKRKEIKQKYINNNNNNEWVKHRKELETSSSER